MPINVCAIAKIVSDEYGEYDTRGKQLRLQYTHVNILYIIHSFTSFQFSVTVMPLAHPYRCIEKKKKTNFRFNTCQPQRKAIIKRRNVEQLQIHKPKLRQK